MVAVRRCIDGVFVPVVSDPSVGVWLRIRARVALCRREKITIASTHRHAATHASRPQLSRLWQSEM